MTLGHGLAALETLSRKTSNPLVAERLNRPRSRQNLKAVARDVLPNSDGWPTRRKGPSRAMRDQTSCSDTSVDTRYRAP